MFKSDYKAKIKRIGSSGGKFLHVTFSLESMEDIFCYSLVRRRFSLKEYNIVTRLLCTDCYHLSPDVTANNWIKIYLKINFIFNKNLLSEINTELSVVVMLDLL